MSWFKKKPVEYTTEVRKPEVTIEHMPLGWSVIAEVIRNDYMTEYDKYLLEYTATVFYLDEERQTFDGRVYAKKSEIEAAILHDIVKVVIPMSKVEEFEDDLGTNFVFDDYDSVRCEDGEPVKVY